VLEVSGLTFRHPRSGRGVEGAGFDLTRGSLTVVTGRVGAGKTTLLRVLLGLLPRQAGEIRWNGAPIGDPGAVLVPPRCAYVPQTPGLFSDTLRGNVLLGLPEAAADLPGALRLAALERDLTALALGLDTPVGPRGVRLSGGQIHRTAAARALVREPELLVLDDLTSALDGETERALWEGLRRRRDATGLAILAVSHRREALERADRILVLEDGHITGAGALDELLASCQELRLLWESQSRPPPTR
jgi:ATP-binding cassette subfamily B protein